MKRICLVLTLTFTGAGAFAADFDLQGIHSGELKAAANNSPDGETPKPAAAEAVGYDNKGLSYVDLVKREYCRSLAGGELSALSAAEVSRLPGTAKRQMAAYDSAFGPERPSRAFHLNVLGWTVHIVQKETGGDIHVSMFFETGEKLASGMRAENGMFFWHTQVAARAGAVPRAYAI